MGDEHVKEASFVVHNVTGATAYLYAVHYDKETFMQELNAALEYIKKSAQE